MAFTAVDLTEGHFWNYPPCSVTGPTSSSLQLTNWNKDLENPCLLFDNRDFGLGDSFGGSAGSKVSARAEITITDGSGAHSFWTGGFLAFSTAAGEYDAQINNPSGIFMMSVTVVTDSGSNAQFYMRCLDNGTYDSQAAGGNLTKGTKYYVTLEYDPALGTYGRATLTVRTGSHAGSTAWTMTYDFTNSVSAFNFFYPLIGNYDVGSGSRYEDALLENVEIEGFSVVDSSDISAGNTEDLTTYTEVDSAGSLAVAADTITATAQDKQDDDYIYRDTVATPDTGSDFVMWMRYGFAFSNSFWYGYFGISDDVGPYFNIADLSGSGGTGNFWGVGILSTSTSAFTVAAVQSAGGTHTQDTASAAQGGLDAYVVAVYNQGAGTLTAHTCLTHPLNVRRNASSGLSVNSALTFDKKYAFCGAGDTGTGSRTWTGTVKNVYYGFEYVDAIVESVTHSVAFDSEGSVPGLAEVLVNSNLTKAPYGGRQSIRIGSRVWGCAVSESNGVTYVLYSDDDGETWSLQGVTSDFAADAMAIHVDENSQPWIALHKSGQSKIQIWQRTTGGSWTKRSTISTGGTSNCESFDIAHDGTTYHLVYGYTKASNGQRRVGHRTSTSSDLSTWSSVTVVDSGDNNGPGPHRDRSVAMMIDTQGDLHVGYGLDESNTLYLKYAFYDTSAGTWTVTSIQAMGTDGDEKWKPQWMSLVTDEDDKPHIVYAAREPTQSVLYGWYVEKTGGSWSTPEQVTSGRYGTTTGLSLSLVQGDVPVMMSDVQDSAEEGILLYSVRPPGGWQHTRIDWDQDQGQYIPDVVYQARYNVSRTRLGVFAFVQGSITSVVSDELLWDDESEPVESGAAFDQSVGLKGFTYPQNGFSVSQVVAVTRGYAEGATHTASFSSVVGNPEHDYARDPGDHATKMTQAIGYTFVPTGGGGDDHFREVLHNASFTQEIDLIRDRIQSVSHALTFDDDIHRVFPLTVEHEIEIDDEIERDGDRSLFPTNTVTVSQTVLMNKEVNLDVSHTVEFGSSGLYIRDWDALSDHFDPGWAATLETDVGVVQFLYPYGLPTQSLTMKKPEFGDVREDFRRKGSVHRNRSGASRTFRVPVYSRFKLTWAGLLRKRAEEFRVRIVEALGDHVQYVDHNGVKHKCIIVDETLLRSQRGPEYVNVQVTLEKSGRIDLDPEGAQ